MLNNSVQFINSKNVTILAYGYVNTESLHKNDVNILRKVKPVQEKRTVWVPA